MTDASAANQKLWSLGFHEDNLFHNRLQIFLTAHALLLTPVGFLLSRAAPPHRFLVGLSLLGMALAVVWLVVQIRARRIITRIEVQLGEDPVYKSIFLTSHRSRWSQTFVLAILLPGIVLAAWLVLGVAFLFR